MDYGVGSLVVARKTICVSEDTGRRVLAANGDMLVVSEVEQGGVDPLIASHPGDTRNVFGVKFNEIRFASQAEIHAHEARYPRTRGIRL